MGKILITFAKCLFMTIVTTFGIYGIVYCFQIRPNNNYIQCHWEKDVYLDKTGCIHHRNFILSADNEMVSTKIYTNCELDTKFHENITYWCEKYADNSYYICIDNDTEQPCVTQPTTSLAFVNIPLILVVMTSSLLCIVYIFEMKTMILEKYNSNSKKSRNCDKSIDMPCKLNKLNENKLRKTKRSKDMHGTKPLDQLVTPQW